MRHSEALAHAGTTQTPETQRRALSIESLNVRDIAILGTSLWNQNEPSAKICKCFSVDTFECPWQQWQVITSPRVETSRFLSFAGNAWKPNCGSARRGSLWWETRWSFTGQIHTLATVSTALQTFLMIFFGGPAEHVSLVRIWPIFTVQKRMQRICAGFTVTIQSRYATSCYNLHTVSVTVYQIKHIHDWSWLYAKSEPVPSTAFTQITNYSTIMYYTYIYIYMCVSVYITWEKIICSKKVWMRKDN